MRLTGLAAIVLLAAGSLLLTGSMAELGLRLYGYEYSPLRIEDGTQQADRGKYLFGNDNFVRDPDLIWRPKSDNSVFNSQGFRGLELAGPKSTDEFRILTVGDSNTLGWHNGASWPASLGRLLEADRPGVTVVNAGVWGYSLLQGVARLREALFLSPDLVLISFGSNDAHPVSVSDRQFLERGRLQDGLIRILIKVRIGQLVAALLDVLRARGDGELDARVPLSEYGDHLAQMIDMAREHDAEVILLTRPFIGTSADPLWWKYWGPQYNVATVEVARQAGVQVIDVYSHFMTSPELLADESHFTPPGHRRAAQLIYERIKVLLR